MSESDSFLTKIEQRKKWFLALTFFGLAVSVTGIILEIIVPNVSSFLKGYQTGGGIALFVIGIIKYLQTVKLIKNQENIKKLEAERADERSQFINMKAYTVTGFIMNLMLYCATCIVGYWNYQVFITLLFVLVVQLVVFIVSKFYFSKKY